MPVDGLPRAHEAERLPNRSLVVPALGLDASASPPPAPVALPADKLEVLPRVGHIPQVEDSAAFNRALIAFLATLGSEGLEAAGPNAP
jgi:pimeloyl-ACP methyl ester carboxylesterase